MTNKLLVLVLTAFFAAPAFAVVLDGDDAVVASSAGKFKDWSLNFFSLASYQNMTDEAQAKLEKNGDNKNERAFFAYNYFSTNFKVDSVQRYSLRVPFGYQAAGYDNFGNMRGEEFQMQDVHFVYSNYDLGYIGDIDLSGKAKFYLPTSKSTMDKKTIGYFRFEGYADYSFARGWLVAYVVKPEIYLQSQTTYLNTNGNPRNTNIAELEHYVQVQWDVHPMVSLTASTGFTEVWKNSSPANAYHPVNNPGGNRYDGQRSTQLNYQMSAWIRPIRGLSFTLVAGNNTELVSYDGDSVVYGSPQNHEFLLLTNYALF